MAVFASSALNVTVIEIHEELEAITVNINTDKPNSVYITVVYSPPSDDKHELISQIEKILHKYGSYHHYLCADININILDDVNISRMYLEVFESSGYKLLSPELLTRETSTSATCIDHIFGNVECSSSD